jgi:hypothetical protein
MKRKIFGPAWEGWLTFGMFAESVKTDLRYVRSNAENDFLNEILATCGSRKLTIPQGRTCWRARLGCKHEEVIDRRSSPDVTWYEDRPYAEKDMKPISNWQGEGRVNPRGIPYLYLATTRDTALAEVRPWIGSVISVARFRVQRKLSVIDCSEHRSMKSAVDLFMDHTRPREDGIWVAIDRAFATPVSRDDDVKEYIPTQIIAESFKSAGFDGVVYNSLLSKNGLNLALFNLDDAGLVESTLYKASSINFNFEQIGSSSRVRVNLYKVEKWSKDDQHIERMLWAGNSIHKAREIFNAEVKRRPRIRLTIRQGNRVLQRWPQH